MTVFNVFLCMYVCMCVCVWCVCVYGLFHHKSVSINKNKFLCWKSLDLQKSCKDSTEFPYSPHLVPTIVKIIYITMAIYQNYGTNIEPVLIQYC